MSYAVKVKDAVCLVTSDGRLFGMDDAADEGFTLKHDTVDTSRFSAKGICSFMGGQYESASSGCIRRFTTTSSGLCVSG